MKKRKWYHGQYDGIKEGTKENPHTETMDAEVKEYSIEEFAKKYPQYASPKDRKE